MTSCVFSDKNGGVMLCTDSTSALQLMTKTFITTYKAKTVNGWGFGAVNSAPVAQVTSLKNLLK